MSNSDDTEICYKIYTTKYIFTRRMINSNDTEIYYK